MWHLSPDGKSRARFAWRSLAYPGVWGNTLSAGMCKVSVIFMEGKSSATE